jgi:hypothetical protein
MTGLFGEERAAVAGVGIVTKRPAARRYRWSVSGSPMRGDE